MEGKKHVHPDGNIAWDILLCNITTIAYNVYIYIYSIRLVFNYIVFSNIIKQYLHHGTDNGRNLNKNALINMG